MAASETGFTVHIVAPHGGAWIEISGHNEARHVRLSPLTEGRGLKWKTDILRIYSSACRPSRRGVD